MDIDYEIIREFDTNGKHMVVVKIGENAHVMDESEIRRKCREVFYGDFQRNY